MKWSEKLKSDAAPWRHWKVPQLPDGDIAPDGKMVSRRGTK